MSNTDTDGMLYFVYLTNQVESYHEFHPVVVSREKPTNVTDSTAVLALNEVEAIEKARNNGFLEEEQFQKAMKSYQASIKRGDAFFTAYELWEDFDNALEMELQYPDREYYQAESPPEGRQVISDNVDR